MNWLIGCLFQTHKQECGNIANYIQMSQKASMRLLRDDRISLPPHVSFFHLRERLRQWCAVHNSLFHWAAYQALYSSEDPGFIHSHFLLITVKPRWDEGDRIRRGFRITGMTTHHWGEIGSGWFTAPWVVQNQVEEIHRAVAGFYAHAQNRVPNLFVVPFMFWCPPLPIEAAMFVLPPEVIARTLRWRDWEGMTIADVEEGSPTSPLANLPISGRWAMQRFCTSVV